MEPSILPTTNITEETFLFDGLAWKHASIQIVFTAIIKHLDKKCFLFCDWAWKENVIQCILSVKLSVAQIFLFDGEAWKHDSMQTVFATIIKCSKKYFLFCGMVWKCFLVYIISHKCTANIFVWCSGLKVLYHGDYWLYATTYIYLLHKQHILHPPLPWVMGGGGVWLFFRMFI